MLDVRTIVILNTYRSSKVQASRYPVTPVTPVTPVPSTPSIISWLLNLITGTLLSSIILPSLAANGSRTCYMFHSLARKCQNQLSISVTSFFHFSGSTNPLPMLSDTFVVFAQISKSKPWSLFTDNWLLLKIEC